MPPKDGELDKIEARPSPKAAKSKARHKSWTKSWLKGRKLELSPALAAFDGIDFEKKRQFLVQLAKDCASYGVPTHRMEYLLESVSESLGTNCSFLVLPGCVMLSVKNIEMVEYQTLILKVNFGFNMNKLRLVNELCHEMLQSKKSLEEALDNLKTIRNEPGAPLLVNLVTFSLTAFIFNMIGFGGSWIDGLGATGLGLLVGGFQILAIKSPGNFSYLFEFTSAMVCAFLANQLATYSSLFCFHPQIMVFSALSLLLPGLGITLAIIEISTRNFVSGVVRLFSCLFGVLLLGFGYSVGQSVYPVANGYTCDAPPMDWVWNIPLIPVGAFAICLTLGAKKQQVPVMVSISSLGFASSLALSRFMQPALVATISTLIIGLVSNIYARMTYSPSVAPVLSGILFLTPGSFGLKASLRFLTGQAPSGQDFAVDMFLIAMSITCGLLISNVVIWPIRKLLPLSKSQFYFLV
ncbi:hypothetical protein HDV03_004397 [Kappamyces sp. JEL0829]|nr:hypothetical protein HDV03_004397 [Kappamyces sp. JEL0829]